jgi:hypothetical protein
MVETITIDKATFDYLFACENILHACMVDYRCITDMEREKINAMHKKSIEVSTQRINELKERLKKLDEEIKKININKGAKNG